MGCDFSAHAFLGFRVAPDEIYERAPSTWVCSTGHVRQDSSQAYCSSCGGRFEEKTRQNPGPAMKTWAGSLGRDPQEVYRKLHGDTGYHIHPVHGLQCSEDRGSAYPLAIGYDLGGAYDTDGGKIHGVPLPDLNHRAVVLEEMARDMGLGDRPVEVFFWLYASV